MNLLDAALEYHRRGVPITLCRPGTKKPLGHGWTKTANGTNWQGKRWTVEEIRRAFRELGTLNVGVVLGPRSGIIDIEADGPEQQQAIAKLFDGCNPPVAPTFSSRRGPHRLYAWSPALSPTCKAVVSYEGVEIRIGAGAKGAQSLLPPSVTDDIRREWILSLDECEPPELPQAIIARLVEANPSRPINGTTTNKGIRLHSRHKPLLVSAVSTESAVFTVSTVSTAIEAAIARTLPSDEGQRNRQVFEFARHLKAVPELSGAAVRSLKPYVELWHRAALPFITTKPFNDSWLDFGHAWSRVKYAAGQEPLAMIYQQAVAGPLPALAEQYPEPELRRLVALCRQLQIASGEQPFFLACRPAGELLGVSHTRANRWLQLLVLDEVLELVQLGKRHQANEYRYLKPLD